MPIDHRSHRHLERLRDIARSAGWPCRDSVELDLLAAGLIRRAADADGRETLLIVERKAQDMTLEGVPLDGACMEDTPPDLQGAIAQALVMRLQREGHLVWRDLPLGGVVCDVYGVRRTSVEDYLHPVAYRIHTRPLESLALALEAERVRACVEASSRCWCVLGPEVACDVERDIPRPWGVLRASPGAGPSVSIELTVERPARQRALRLPVRYWMSLARSAPVPTRDGADRAAQAMLAEAQADPVDAPLR